VDVPVVYSSKTIKQKFLRRASNGSSFYGVPSIGKCLRVKVRSISL
jgi:hypothetical protein